MRTAGAPPKSRGQGGSWSAPGDPLKGRPTADLLRTAEGAASAAAALDRAALGDLCIATDARTVEESAASITTAWPDLWTASPVQAS
jgi:hypothetical protein